MFSQLRRAVARSIPVKTIPKRQFGAHGEHHVEYMSTHSELPPGDWRNKPMTWDFSRKPTSDYEVFVQSHLSGPDDPALQLTKGQFIVYMRRLHREEFGHNMYWQRVYMGTMLLAFVGFTNSFWANAHNTNTTTFAQRQFSSIFDTTGLQGATSSQDFRFRLDEFFAEHDPETIEKLPKDLKELYLENKDAYREQYASTPQLVQPAFNLLPQGILKSKQKLMRELKLSNADIANIYLTCDQHALYQQMYALDDEAMAQKFPRLAPGTSYQKVIMKKLLTQRRKLKKIQKELRQMPVDYLAKLCAKITTKNTKMAKRIQDLKTKAQRVDYANLLKV